jgi:DNA polymerase-1
VWHHYGFDRHVLWNEGIDVYGFGGDTMHMARLQDTSRAKMGGYSLESLTDALIGRRKQPMKELFGVKRKRKDGTDGLLTDIPSVEVPQRDPLCRKLWIEYSCFDAEGTWLLREKLQKLLEGMKWCQGKNLYDYYQMHMRPFGKVLTDMERRGIRVDAREYLAKVEVQARQDRSHHLAKFRTWAESQIGPDGLALNPASSVQLTTFLFGGALNDKTKVPTEAVRVFKVPREELSDEAMEAYRTRDETMRAQAPQKGMCMLY